jgi:hypothetical protein
VEALGVGHALARQEGHRRKEAAVPDRLRP